MPTELDLRGLNCPMPVLRTAKALRPLIFGARISVLASDPLARIDIPHFCREHGHVLEECDTTGEALRFVIRKGMGPETGS
nr:sulfurtransferase TusA family protein [Breoghania corrubedonensis]